MRNRSASRATLAAAAVLGLGVAGSAVGATAATTLYRINASMTAKAAHPTPTGSVGKARGSVVGNATLDRHSQVAWKLTYSGMTGRVTAALVRYRNAKGLTTAISLCTKPCKSGLKSFTFFRTKSEGLYFVKQVRAGKVDAVLETKRNPQGEVRGVLRARRQSS